MYFSNFMVIIAVCLVVCGYFEYKKWVVSKELKEKLLHDKEILEMYEEYQKFLKKYPDFEKKKRIIQKIMQRAK